MVGNEREIVNSGVMNGRLWLYRWYFVLLIRLILWYQSLRSRITNRLNCLRRYGSAKRQNALLRRCEANRLKTIKDRWSQNRLKTNIIRLVAEHNPSSNLGSIQNLLNSIPDAALSWCCFKLKLWLTSNNYHIIYLRNRIWKDIYPIIRMFTSI